MASEPVTTDSEATEETKRNVANALHLQHRLHGSPKPSETVLAHANVDEYQQHNDGDEHLRVALDLHCRFAEHHEAKKLGWDGVEGLLPSIRAGEYHGE